MHRVLFVGVVLLFVPLTTQAATVTFLTSGVSYSTPVDWNNSDNSIECIGAGGNGADGDISVGGGGGGGGAYAKIVNLTIAGSISYSVASGGSQADTTFNSTSLVCDAGNNASGATGGAGGTTAASTGSTEFAGGSGQTVGFTGGGGGGAGGTTSAGSDGAASTGGVGGSVSGGSGGDAGDAVFGLQDAGAGGNGTVWQVSPARGAGGGGGGGYVCFYDGDTTLSYISGGNGGNGGNFGAGGGGGGRRGSTGDCISLSPGSQGFGTQGLIVVTYTPASTPATAVRSGLKILPFGSLKITGGGIKIK